MKLEMTSLSRKMKNLKNEYINSLFNKYGNGVVDALTELMFHGYVKDISHKKDIKHILTEINIPFEIGSSHIFFNPCHYEKIDNSAFELGFNKFIRKKKLEIIYSFKNK